MDNPNMIGSKRTDSLPSPSTQLQQILEMVTDLKQHNLSLQERIEELSNDIDSTRTQVAKAINISA